MIRYFYFLLVPLTLFATLSFDTNYNRNIRILKAFDINPSFLYDKKLNQMEIMEKARYKYKHFFRTMNDAYIFIPRIKEILSQYNIPSQFLYLAMAESNFSTGAYSNKKAVGMWQFMPSTAKIYHLKVNRYVDERRDLIQSTVAAAKYLSYLHKRFGKWYLAAIAYNCGGGYLNNAIRRAGTNKLTVLLNPKKHFIPEESRLYIRKILALAIVGNDENHILGNEYDFLLDRGNAYSLATVHVDAGASLVRISKIVGIPLEELRKLNRNLKYNFVPPNVRSYHVYIPYIKLATFKQRYRPAKFRHIYKIHIVRTGESLYELQRRYHVSYEVIKNFNHLRSSVLSLGQHLIIPILVHKNYIPFIAHFKNRYTKVKRGDTLKIIARRHHISIKWLKKENHLTSDMIIVGERLAISRTYYKISRRHRFHRHFSRYDTVKRGDTLGLIAQRNHISVRFLKKENHLSNNIIKIGEKLAVR